MSSNITHVDRFYNINCESFFSVCAIVWQKANRRETRKYSNPARSKDFSVSAPQTHFILTRSLPSISPLSVSHTHKHTHKLSLTHKHIHNLCVWVQMCVSMSVWVCVQKSVWVNVCEFQFLIFSSLLCLSSANKTREIQISSTLFFFVLGLSVCLSVFLFVCLSVDFFVSRSNFSLFLNFVKKRISSFDRILEKGFSFDVRWFVKTKQSSNVEKMIFGHTDWKRAWICIETHTHTHTHAYTHARTYARTYPHPPTYTHFFRVRWDREILRDWEGVCVFVWVREKEWEKE